MAQNEDQVASGQLASKWIEYMSTTLKVIIFLYVLVFLAGSIGMGYYALTLNPEDAAKRGGELTAHFIQGYKSALMDIKNDERAKELSGNVQD